MRRPLRPAAPKAAEESRCETVGGALFGRKAQLAAPVLPGDGALFGSGGGEGKSSAAFGAACAHQTLLIEHTVAETLLKEVWVSTHLRGP
ncbi:hypothetical protein Q8A67_023227 [Cirrhinus molitorella]|uniref:Uncharacterized protein n=1 Tax=Cirrhinus molitorella TaxID=172907 RepID=A0AA88NZJ8_9TELE|nr:hypothetical protein Q8A67_023227 [Cirrhinus molitorella]